MSSALLRQTLSGRSAALLALIAALSIFLAYAPTAQAQVSVVADLSALTLHVDGQPLTLDTPFARLTTDYAASVDSSDPWLTVTPTAADSGATITVNTSVLSSAIPVTSAAASPLLLLNTDAEASGVELAPIVGANTIDIVVTAEDTTTTKTYTVTVSRPNAGCGTTTSINASHTRLLADCATLLGLRDELQGTAALNWAANVDITTWEGITISGSRLVSGIAIVSKNLDGSIPPELGSLLNLTQLYLNSNQLTSGIPTQLGYLNKLTHLYLSDNLLTSGIPTQLGNLPELEELYLSNNQLTGSIPPALGSLTNLTQLALHENRLTGVIPIALGSLTNLDRLWLHCNGLTGGIPTELAALDGNLSDGLWLQGNPLNPPTIPVGLTPGKVRLRGAQGSWTEAVWCGPPEFADASATRTVVEGTASGQAIGAPVAATDPDNRPLGDSQPLTYTLGGTDATHFAIDSATGQLRVGSAALDYANPADANMDNDYELTVTATDGVASPTGGEDDIDVTVRVTRSVASTDATLLGLTISPGTLNETFASGTEGYTASVPYSVSSVTVTPTVNHSGATVTVNGGSASVAQSLTVGSNTITIIVTAQDGTTPKTYTVTVTRAAASTDATLRGLTISPGTLNETFASGTEGYTASVPYSVSSVTVTPTANHSGATITMGTGSDTVASGAASDAQTLVVGDNAIVITVTAEAGNTKIYTVTVRRAARVYLPDWGGVEGAAVAGDDGVTLTWQAPITGSPVKGYRILRREADFTAYVEIHDTTTGNNPTATTYVDPHSSAESGKDYMYRVKAVNTACLVGPDWYAGDGRGWPDRKNFGRAAVQPHSTPLSVPAAPAVAPVAPQMGNGSDAAGSNNGKVNGAVATSSGITVTWQAPTNAGSDGATVLYYLILRREDGERQPNETALIANKHLAGSDHKYRKIHNTYLGVSPTATTYTDSDVVSGKTYLYRVRAINNNCYISPDPTRHDQTGYSFDNNNFGKATAQ